MEGSGSGSGPDTVWVYAASTREGGVDYKYIYSLVVDLRSFLRVR